MAIFFEFGFNRKDKYNPLGDVSKLTDDQLIKALIKYSGNPPQELISENYEDPELTDKPVGQIVRLDEARTKKILPRYREEFAKRGMVLFINGIGYKAPNFIGIVRAKSPFEVMRLVGTSAPNYDLTMEYVIAEIGKYATELGLEFEEIRMDGVRATITKDPADWLELAKSLHLFCPDILGWESDTWEGHTLEELAKKIEATKTFYLWWD